MMIVHNSQYAGICFFVECVQAVRVGGVQAVSGRGRGLCSKQ